MARNEAVIVDAVRTPIGKYGGVLQELLPERRREPLGNYTRLGVRQATSGVRNNHPDRPLRPGLSLENGRG